MHTFTHSKLRRRRIGYVALVAAAAVASACGGGGETQQETASARIQYVDAGDSLPRIRFADGQVSVNDRCMVRQTKLNLRMPPVYVNGQPVGFC